jgi:hypothetical protein
LGAGIRLNWDHDNGNESIQDRLLIETTAIPDENDLIEVRVDAIGAMNLILEVDWWMSLFWNHTGGTPDRTHRT